MADWFNNNLSDYIDQKEKVMIDVRKNDKVCRLSGVVGGFFIALFVTLFITIFKLVIAGLISGQEPNLYANLLFVLIMFICSYPFFVCLVYNSNRASRYVLTNFGIYEINGLFFKRLKVVAYNQITDVDMSRGLLDQFFGCGSVGVGTASGNVVGSISDGNGSIYSANELDILHIDNYKEVRQFIIGHRRK